MVGGETGLLVPVGDVRSFCESVDALSDNQDLRNKMAAAGRARAEERTLNRSLQSCNVLLTEVSRGTFASPTLRSVDW